jgi:hypothetical protein
MEYLCPDPSASLLLDCILLLCCHSGLVSVLLVVGRLVASIVDTSRDCLLCCCGSSVESRSMVVVLFPFVSLLA